MSYFLTNAYLIPLLPLAAAALIRLTPLGRSGRLSGWIAALALALGAIIALGTAAAVAADSAAAAVGPEWLRYAPPPSVVNVVPWAPGLTMGYLVDPLAAAMLVMVTVIGCAIQVYAVGYLAGEARQGRFFAYTSAFAAAMLGTVLSSNLLMLFICWELMGLCSYLLIGFRSEKTYVDPARITPAQAAIKAFITTRIGDLLLLVGIAALWYRAGTLEFGSGPAELFDPQTLARLAATPDLFGLSALALIALLLFCGTIGKSAQLPLHVWLPDAMEGPTPVSALIHAATMVAAGVFLVARTYPVFVVSGMLPLVAVVGAASALFGALVACAQYDIKRILAFSTMSQLGFMVAALGIGGWVPALFHLLTHATFKALLFLGSGSVIHGAHEEQDIRHMGGLRRAMPLTFGTYMVGAAALAGIPPLAGFWSKDEILADALSHGHALVTGTLLLTSFLTAFYTARQVTVIFFGADHGDPDHPAHESPPTMTGPLLLLAGLSLLVGFLNTPLWYGLKGFLLPQAEKPEFSLAVALLGALLAVAGAALGYRVYRGAFATPEIPDPVARLVPRLFLALEHRLYVDELYAAVFGRLVALMQAGRRAFDNFLIAGILGGLSGLASLLGRLFARTDDGVLNAGGDAIARGAVSVGDQARRTVSGRAQDYLAWLALGAVLLGALLLYR